jgi:hypothetical protein
MPFERFFSISVNENPYSVKKRYTKNNCLRRLSACLLASILLLQIHFSQASPLYASAAIPGNTITIHQPVFFAPMRFLRFSATGDNGRVSIGWKVTNEKDQFEYIIERSVDGIDFMPVGTLIYKTTITPINNYSFTDLVPVVNHINYYRVRSLDVNGRSTLSRVVKVKLSTPVGALVLNPSPADESASLSLVSKSRGTVSVRIVNKSGRACWHLHYSIVAGPNLLLLDGLDKLPEGDYTVQCVDGRKTRQVALQIHHQH